MSLNSDVQPISLVERRAARLADPHNSAPLSIAQQRAYRQLAIAALGLDLPTLTRELRGRRIQRMPELRLGVHGDQAA
jgi:hypothetical protein